ncbi:MAG: phosphoribosyltransferase family protein, partial [Bacteroidia bacterium]
ITLSSAIINKQNPIEGNILFSLSKDDFKGKTIVLVDDVLNSGKTMLHVIADLTRFDCKIIRTVVLVDRMHRLYPVRADFVGLTLSTTLEEHIEVEFEKDEINAYLRN